MNSTLPEDIICPHFSSWFSNSISYSLTEETQFKELYNNYKNSCLERGIIADSRSLFSRLLRKHLKDKIGSLTVKIVNNKGIVYRGLILKK